MTVQNLRADVNSYSLRQLTLYSLKLGTVGFGGPVALIGYMHRDLVEQRKWISESDYKDGLALAQLAPGPLAAQLAIYLGRSITLLPQPDWRCRSRMPDRPANKGEQAFD